MTELREQVARMIHESRGTASWRRTWEQLDDYQRSGYTTLAADIITMAQQAQGEVLWHTEGEVSLVYPPDDIRAHERWVHVGHGKLRVPATTPLGTRVTVTVRAKS